MCKTNTKRFNFAEKKNKIKTPKKEEKSQRTKFTIQRKLGGIGRVYNNKGVSLIIQTITENVICGMIFKNAIYTINEKIIKNQKHIKFKKRRQE